MNVKNKALTHLILYLVTLAVNTMGNYGIINGMTQKAVSDKYPTLITPQPFVFSIWGVIYVLVLIGLIYMLVKHKETSTAQLIQTIHVPFLISCAANILWIVTFSFEWVGISALLALVMSISVAEISARHITPQTLGQKVSALGFGVYGGWVVIAVVLNVAAFLVQVEWDGFGLAPETWTIIVLIAALVIAALIQLRVRNAALTLPLAWAYFGIWQRHQNGTQPAIQTTALIIMVVYVLLTVAMFVLNKGCVLPKNRTVKAEAEA